MFEDLEVITRDMLPKEMGTEFGHISNLRGKKNELRFLNAWNDYDVRNKPCYCWVEEAIPGTPQQDSCGIDAVLHTSIPEFDIINVQIKSSYGPVNRFSLRHPDIVVVVIEDEFSYERIRRQTVHNLSLKHPALRKTFRRFGCNLKGIHIK